MMRNGRFLLWVIFATFLLIGQSVLLAQESIDWTTSDFIPPTGKTEPQGGEESEGPWNRRILMAVSADGGLTWQRTGQAISDQADYPTAWMDAEGRIFIYFVSYHPDYRNATVAAVSSDEGATWVYKAVNFEGLNRSPVDPSVVPLAEGGVRMYFNATWRGNQVEVYSAVSQDGLNFSIDNTEPRYTLPNESIFAPSAVQIGEEIHLYTIGRQGEKFHAVSADGLTFTAAATPSWRRDDFVGQGTVPLGEGRYRMLTFTPVRPDAGFVPPMRSYTSSDGVNWEHEGGERLIEDATAPLEGAGLFNPALVELADGRYLMFYSTRISD